MSNIVIVIPTYNPTQLLLNTLKDIDTHESLSKMKRLVVNDGSSSGVEYFVEAQKKDLVELIEHDINKGKGEAIKTAIAHLQKVMPEIEYIITVDSDRQHLGKDVVSVLESIKKNGSGLHIGSRKLAKDKTPMRSYVGNLISRKFFYFLYKVELQDTQSGLRAYPKSCFNFMLSLKSHRYEFEMEAVIATLLNKIKIFETSIETVYINKNQSSHFRPLVDSLKVIWIIVKMKIKKPVV